jgi:hypothetical protein
MIRGGKIKMRKNLLSKPILLATLALMLLLAACSPGDQQDIQNGELPPQAVLAAQQMLSEEVNVSFSEIEIVDYEQVDWPDACLGVPEEGQACAQVITPGFRVVLEVNGQQYEFRTDQEGNVVVQAPE